MINVHQFNNEPLRLLLVTLGTGLRATETLIHPNFQKHAYRELKMTDAIIQGKDIKWNSSRARYVLTDDKDEDAEGENGPVASKKGSEVKVKSRPPTQKIPTKANPFHLNFYGLLCTSAKSYQSGLCM
jgi:general transcription factor 3C polypeptide 3 (transcription factor C subunit 4)